MTDAMTGSKADSVRVKIATVVNPRISTLLLSGTWLAVFVLYLVIHPK